MFVQLVLLAGSVVLEFVRIGYVLRFAHRTCALLEKFVFRCLFVREKPVVDDRLRFDGTVGQTVQTNTASESAVSASRRRSSSGGFYHLLIGRSALGGDFGSIEGQLQIDLRTQPARLPAEGVCR